MYKDYLSLTVSPSGGTFFYKVLQNIERGKMNANKQAKVNEVSEIKNKISKSQALVVVEYSGLTVKQFQVLRRELKAQDVELAVYKNRLFKIAATESGLAGLETDLIGQNAFAFGYSDDIAPAKILAKFAKDNEALKLKAGTFEGKVIDAAEVAKVAKLPSFEEALTILAMQLISPVKFIGVGLHQLVTEQRVAE